MMLPPRPRVSDMHAHLVCVLCGGYYVDATTIVECLHSFCRSCIVRYLESSKFCPMCDVQVHKTRPLLNLRSDKTLQSLVYKMVPGVYSTEMKRRREYYEKLREKGADSSGCASSSPEDRGEPENPEIFSSDDSISLSLEYYTGEDEDAQGEEDQSETKKETRQVTHKRYLQCPAAVCMRHLKKFIRLKYGLSPDYKVDIIYQGECLREEFTLMDVAYTFNWKRNSSLRFSYRIYERPRITHCVGVTATDRKISDSGEEPPVKRPRLLSSDGHSSSSSHHMGAVSSSASQPKPKDTDMTPSEQSSSETLSTPAHEKLRSRSEIKTVTPKPTPPPQRPKTPKEKKESTPRSNSSDSKRDSTPKTIAQSPKASAQPPKASAQSPKASAQPPKTISQPPKPIMPGQKPPSQTSLMLQQRIMQQRQQHQKMQLQKQQQQQQHQQKLQMQKQLHSLQQKQIPSLQKLHSIPRTTPTIKLNRPSSSPSVPHSKPSVSSATQATSKPVVQATSSLKSPATPSKPVPSSVPRPSPSQTPTNKPSQQAVNKPPPPALTNPPKPSPSVEPRRDDSNLIDKNKMRPVVVIERHAKKPDKSPAPEKKVRDKSPKVTPKSSTVLAVAPGSTVTKLKLVKRHAGSPGSNPPVAKKVASEIPKPAPPLNPLEVPRAPGEPPRHDDFGALDLSGKSSRKSDSPCSSHSSGAPSPPAPSPTEPPLKPPQPPRTNMSTKQSKNQSPQTSIMSIAQTLVNRQLSNLAFNGDGSRSPNSPHSQGSSSPSSQGSGSGQNFRNLMTLSDTAVHLLSAQQRGPLPQPRMRLPSPAQQANAGVKINYGRGPSSQNVNMKSPAPPSTPTIRIPITVPSLINKTSTPPRTAENGSLLSPNRIPRINDLFPGPQSKPGQNQGLRHIPNPSLLGFRQQANRMQHHQQQQQRKDEITITPASPPSISSIRKIENLTRNICEGKVPGGLGVRVGDSAQ